MRLRQEVQALPRAVCVRSECEAPTSAPHCPTKAAARANS
ncbi:hypothetical protein BF49_0578 [Bradyrhizobium sp.]|nr:hypothetical protein BF49_0578 [Bradyrhizobium sp.]